jgi:plasmid stability protein
MSDKDQYPSEAAERFQLRLPPGLRDRIKAYAEKHGRSMNTEIIRVLEREYPETWPLSVQITQIVSLSNALKDTIEIEALNKVGTKLLETVEGVASGRVLGVDDETRQAVADWLVQWQESFDDVHRDEFEAGLDPEEQATWDRVGSTAKFIGASKDSEK